MRLRHRESTRVDAGEKSRLQDAARLIVSFLAAVETLKDGWGGGYLSAG